MEYTKIRFGFRGKKLLPLFLVWREYWCEEEVYYAKVLFRIGWFWD